MRHRFFVVAALVVGVMMLSRLPLDSRLLTPQQPTNTQVQAGAFPKRLHDPLGHQHWLQQPVGRIASGVLAADEILVMLRAADRVVNVTDIVDDPGISNVAQFYAPDVLRTDAETEALLMTNPDLVVMAAYSDAATVRMLLAAGVTVLRLPLMNSFADIENYVTTLSRVTGTEARAAEVLQMMQQRLAAVDLAVRDQPKPRVLYYSPSGSAASVGTLSDEMVMRAGGYNVMRDTALDGSALVSQELAVALQPDVILLDIWGTTRGDPVAVQAILNDPAWRGTPAAQQGRVYVVDGAIATTCTPFRVIGVETIAHLLHPQRVPAPLATAQEVARWL